jgi:hypothetical protein
MRLPPRAETTAALLLALARLAVSVYRAMSQSIVHDEAFTFSHYVDGPWSSVYSQYDANNHVLYSILSKLCVRTFGVSELAFRLPSLAAGFLLILAVFWLLRLAAPPLARWTAFVALSLHPLLLDFSAAGRGYSMSLALFLWAMFLLLAPGGRWRHVWAGALLGLAASANLAILFPAFGLAIAAVWLDGAAWKTRWKILPALLVPAAIFFGVICFGALRTAQRADFYAGTPTFYDFLLSMVQTSINVSVYTTGLFGTAAAARTIVIAVLPFAAALILFASGGLLREPDSRWRLLPLLTLLLAILGLVAGHLVLHLNYPIDRTGLYLVPLFGLAWAIAAGAERNAWRLWLHGLMAVALTLQFATQFQTRYFLVWQYDMDDKDIARMLQSATAARPAGSVTVSVTWMHQPALEFYRQYLGIASLRPIERQAPTPLTGYDFYVLNNPDTQRPEKDRLPVIFTGAAAGVVVARNP